MRVYLNLVILVLGVGGATLALGVRTVSSAAPDGTIPTVGVGLCALVALAWSLLSSRSEEGDLGLGFGVLLLGGLVAGLSGYLEVGAPLWRAIAAAGAVTLPHLLLAAAIGLRSGPSNEAVLELIDNEGPLENRLLALSLGGVQNLTLLEGELRASESDPQRLARCVDLLGAFPRNQSAFDLAQEALASSEAGVRCAALRAMSRIDPGSAAAKAREALEDADAEVRAAAAEIAAGS